jgi:poly(glycerol-phosphate) alpha-glucosyltransferase
MLEPWALANSAWKKRAFRWLVEEGNLRSSSCIHALCDQEARSIRALGFDNPIAVIPNGVGLPDISATRTRAEFDKLFPEVRGRRVMLFLGRVHPKKGLPHLLDAWVNVARDPLHEVDGWVLVVAGPDQLGHVAQVEARSRALGIERDVVFTGPLYGDAKHAALAASDALVLPSFSEGLPMAVLEAMAWQVPVLITRQCNVDVEALGAGLLAEPTATSVGGMLCRFFELSQEERQALGASGRKAVEQHFTWPTVARRMCQVYEWSLGGGLRPDCVAGHVR